MTSLAFLAFLAFLNFLTTFLKTFLALWTFLMCLTIFLPCLTILDFLAIFLALTTFFFKTFLACLTALWIFLTTLLALWIFLRILTFNLAGAFLTVILNLMINFLCFRAFLCFLMIFLWAATLFFMALAAFLTCKT